MSPDDIAAQLEALDNEFKHGNIGLWNYKTKIQQVFDLAYQVAEEHAELTKRVAVLEKLVPTPSST